MHRRTPMLVGRLQTAAQIPEIAPHVLNARLRKFTKAEFAELNRLLRKFTDD